MQIILSDILDPFRERYIGNSDIRIVTSPSLKSFILFYSQ